MFCRGAGIDAGQPAGAATKRRLLQLAGRLLRETLLGLKEILRAQQVFVDHNGIERDVPEGRSPLDANMDEYLVELLAGHEKRQLDAVMRLRDQFAHASQPCRGHRSGTARRARAVPAATWRRSGWPAARMPPPTGIATGMCTATCCRPRDGRLPHLFLEALAQAYQEARGEGLKPVPLQRNVVGDAGAVGFR